MTMINLKRKHLKQITSYAWIRKHINQGDVVADSTSTITTIYVYADNGDKLFQLSKVSGSLAPSIRFNHNSELCNFEYPCPIHIWLIAKRKYKQKQRAIIKERKEFAIRETKKNIRKFEQERATQKLDKV